jgi:hypothetical protein
LYYGLSTIFSVNRDYACYLHHQGLIALIMETASMGCRAIGWLDGWKYLCNVGKLLPEYTANIPILTAQVI